MRVLMITPNISGGGIGTVVMTLYRSLTKQGIECDVTSFVIPSAELQNEIENDNNQVFVINSVSKSGPVGFIKQVYDLCINNKYQAVHIHTSLLIWLSAFGAKMAGVPVRVGHSHGAKFLNYGVVIRTILEVIGRPLNRWLCTHYVTCSSASGRYDFGTDTYIVLPNYIPISDVLSIQKTEIQRMRQILNPEKAKYLLAYIGCLDGIKNTIMVPNVVAELRKNGIDASAILVGNTENAQAFEKLIAELGIEKYCKLLGYRNDAHLITQSCDYFITTSLSEGMSLSLVYAQMSGKPCFVSSKLPKENDLEIGLYHQIDSFDPTIWGQKIIKLIKDGVSPISRDEAVEYFKFKNRGEKYVISQLVKIYNDKTKEILHKNQQDVY